MTLTPFHIAVGVRDLDEARHFYGELMGLPEGRSCDQWIDFNMFGHQFVVHLEATLGRDGSVQRRSNPVDGHDVPIPHCGVVLEIDDWQLLADRVRGFVNEFVVEPYVRFEGESGEQRTMFFLDPSGNALEFKSFKDIDRELFATE
jgi:extradiol dioxygenase family protein